VDSGCVVDRPGAQHATVKDKYNRKEVVSVVDGHGDRFVSFSSLFGSSDSI